MYFIQKLQEIVGGSLIKNTDLEKQSFGQGGQDNQWAFFKGVKQDTKKKVIACMYEKKNSNSDSVDFFKKEPTSLIKFKHPKILQVVDPLIEDKKVMGYVVEDFDQTLQQRLQKNQDACGSQIELKIQLQNLFQILNFLHYTVKSGHFNLSPHNIYILPDNTWKLGGFQFSSQILDNEAALNSFDMKNAKHPNFNYMAPEIQKTGKGSFQSDIFSLGLIIVQLVKQIHDKGQYKPIFDILSQTSYVSEMQHVYSKISSQPFFQSLDQDLKDILSRMLSDDPEKRPLISELIHCKWLNDPFVKAMKHLETIHNIEQQQQSVFLKGLGQILFKYPENISKKIIIPQLLDLFKYPHLILPVLQICIDSIEKLSKEEYSTIIWPRLQKLTVQKEMPAQALYILVENLEKLYGIAGQKSIETSVIPLLLKCYDCQVAKLQELGLQKTEFIVKNWEYGSFTKPKIVPRVINILGHEKTALNVTKKTLSLVKNLLKIIDKQSKNDLLIPALDKLRKNKTDLEIRMQMLQIYQIISKDLDVNTIGSKLVPSLLPFLIDPNLKRNEYLEYSKTITQLLQKVDEERLKELPVESDAFDFNQIANKTDVNQAKQSTPSTSQQQLDDFDFLDNLAGKLQQPKTQHQPNQQTTTPVQNQTKQDDDFFFDNPQNSTSNQPQQQQQNTISQPKPQQQQSVQQDPFFEDFNQNQSNFTQKPQNNSNATLPGIAPPKPKTSTTPTIQPPQKKPQQTSQSQQQKVSQDPFFDSLNQQSKFQQQKPKQQQQQNDDPFFQDFNQQQQKQQKPTQNINQDPFFSDFNSQQQKSNQQFKQTPATTTIDDPFAEISTPSQSSYNNNNNNNYMGMNVNTNTNSSNNNNNFSNTGMSMGFGGNSSQPVSAYDPDNPFAEIESNQNKNQNQGQNQNQNPTQQQQNKGQLFSKMNIKKPTSNNTYNNNIGSNNNNNDDFDLI